MSGPEKDPLVGTVVDGRYRVLSLVAEGGMGVVYRAEHVFLKREVALKRLHPELTGHGEAVARFEREAQAAARIDHPNVCAVLDCGIGGDGAVYIAMELLEGDPLDRRIRDAAPLPLAEIAGIAGQICDALHRAHELGVVHRDLKPENVMLVPRRDGPGAVVKIMDFGIAKMAQEAGGAKLTRAGVVFGTPDYIAPEQAAGGAVDRRADLYALGVVLYEMATGRRPFESPTVSGLLTKHLTERAPPLEAAAPHLAFPPGFRDLVARCLAKDPGARFPTAEALGEALRAIRPAEPPPPQPWPAAAPVAPAQGVGHLPTMPLGGAQAVVPVTAALGHGKLIGGSIAAVAALGLIATIVSLAGGSGEGPGADAAADSPGGGERLAASAGAEEEAGPAVDASSAAARLAAPERDAAGGTLGASPGEESGAGPPAREPPDAQPGPEGALAAERQAFENSVETVAAAVALAKEGRTADAISRFEWLAQSQGASAHYHFLLAVLYDRDGRPAQAIDHALRSQEIDGRYGTESELLSLASRALGTNAASEAAARFLERVLDPAVAENLVRAALDSSASTVVLRRIHEVLVRSGLLDTVPAHLRLPLVASAEKACAKRKEAFRAIAAAPDARMAPYLRRFRSDSGCGILDMQDCWSCERSAIRSAIGAVDAAASGGRSDGGA